MPLVHWPVTPDGRYWIDVALGKEELLVMIDSGLVDPLDRIGLELDPSIFDELKRKGQLLPRPARRRRDASGGYVAAPTGRTTVQLLHPRSKQQIGPAVVLDVFRGAAGVPQCVGVVFFHRLAGCRVIWELDQRLWGIEYL